MTMSIKLLHLKVQVISYWFRIMVPLLYKYCIQLILFINQVHTTLTLFHSYFNLILSMGGQLKSILNLLSI